MRDTIDATPVLIQPQPWKAAGTLRELRSVLRTLSGLVATAGWPPVRPPGGRAV